MSFKAPIYTDLIALSILRISLQSLNKINIRKTIVFYVRIQMYSPQPTIPLTSSLSV